MSWSLLSRSLLVFFGFTWLRLGSRRVVLATFFPGELLLSFIISPQVRCLVMFLVSAARDDPVSGEQSGVIDYG